MKTKPKVYIADLRHTADRMVANACMPLGIGYMKAVMDRDLPEVECRLFAYPDQLLEAMESNIPDVLMLTNYVWNERLARYFSSIAKRMHNNILVVAGGPNLPVEDKRKIEFLEGWTDLDVYALGEGDFLATEIVRRFLLAGKSIVKLAEMGVPSSMVCLAGEIVHQPLWKKDKEVGKIPSPWLSGVQDHFFDGKLIPMLETNRGCPFQCTFCVQGTDYYSRMGHFEEDQVKEELTYIARRIKETCPNMGAFMIADSNFGMFKRDVDIASHIGELRKTYGWPVFVNCSPGKNAPDLVIKTIEKSNGTFEGVYHSVQSMNEDVLKSIKRSNIKLDSYGQVTEYFGDKGVRTFSQTILGLPKETLQTHLEGLRTLVDNGIDSLQNLQLMLLKGCEIESQASRDEFGFQTKFRLSPRCFGTYKGETIFDVEEISVASESLSFDDYIYARKYHLALMVFWNQDLFNDPFRLAQNFGIEYSTCIEALFIEMNSDDGAVGELMIEFLEETKGELFSTPEECFKFYSEKKRLDELASGEIGDNLMNKYRAIASFLLWPEICELVMRALKRILITNGFQDMNPGFEIFWEDLSRYVECKHASGRSERDILSPVNCEMQHDVLRWIADGHPKNLSSYKLETSKTFLFQLNEDSANEILNALETWSTDLRGLTKVARHLRVTSLERHAIKSGQCL
jgi:radical SAM superfamily enzyme YgiQ (UPF0313 family)